MIGHAAMIAALSGTYTPCHPRPETSGDGRKVNVSENSE
jgi:hypothetical protein